MLLECRLFDILSNLNYVVNSYTNMKITYLINVTLTVSFTFPLNLEECYRSYKWLFVWWHHYSITQNKFTEFSRAITIPTKRYQTNTKTNLFTTKRRWQTWRTFSTTNFGGFFQAGKRGIRTTSTSLTALLLWHEEMLGRLSDITICATTRMKIQLLC